MADDEGGRELPQRVRGAARGGSASTAPVLSEEVRQRIQAAVRAERAERSEEDQETAGEQAQRATGAGPAGGPTGQAANDINAKRKHVAVKSDPGLKAEHAVKPEADAKADHEFRSPHGIKPERAVEGDRADKPGQGSANPGQESKSRLNGSGPAAAPPAPAAPRRPAQPPPGAPRPARRGARIAVLALAIVAIGLAGTVVGLGVAKHPAGSLSTAALEHQELVARTQAASWVVQQVDHTAVVSCDPVMCTALANDGFPARKLVVLGPASPTAPVSSQVVIVTAAVRDWFGSSLAAAYAPAVLASFASGSAQVSVRVMAPHGVGAYDAAADLDLTQRKAFGDVLLNSKTRITIAGPAQQQLAAGQVDARLILALTTLAGDLPINVVKFGNPGQGASPGIPLRVVYLAANDPAASTTSSVYQQNLHTAVTGLSMDGLDRTQTTVLPGHGTVIQIEFTAPSPFGLLTGH